MDSLPLECPECGKRFSRESRFCPHDGEALLEMGAPTLLFDAGSSGPASRSFEDSTDEDSVDSSIVGHFDGEYTREDDAPRVPSRVPSLPPPPVRPPQQPQKDPLLGALVGSYRVEGLLGQGGMGRIYRAVHTQLGKLVAIKVLRTEVAGDSEANTRFIREARQTSALGHPNIVDVLDFGALEDGRAYFVMELLEGASLHQVIQRLGRLEPGRALRMVERLASALQAAHTRGVIHRDLKPGNVFVCGDITRSAEVKLLDFGIAKIANATIRLTVAGSIFGTPQYMAPEQCIGSDVDHRADIYALGIMLFEMLTGSPPFDDPVPVEILIQQRSSPIPKLPQELGALQPLIQRVLAKNPAERYQSMRDFGVALEDANDALNAPPPIHAVVAQPVASYSPPAHQPSFGVPQAPPSQAPPPQVHFASQVPTPAPPLSFGAAPSPASMARTIAFDYSQAPPSAAAAVPYSNGPPASAQEPASGPSPLAPPPPIAAAPSSRGHIILLVLGALSVIVIGAGLVITFASPTRDVAPNMRPLTPAALVNVITQPAGAQLYSGENQVGVTPCPVSRPTTDQAFRVSLSGHIDAVFTLGPSSPDVHSVVLAPSP